MCLSSETESSISNILFTYPGVVRTQIMPGELPDSFKDILPLFGKELDYLANFCHCAVNCRLVTGMPCFKKLY